MTRAEPSVHLIIDERAQGRVARLAVDHPGKLNILNRALMQALLRELEMLAADEALRVLVLSGAGDSAFIGGADIREMAALTPRSARTFIQLLHRVCDGLRRLPVPVIARIRGYALGAGLEVAAACDLRIAAQDARFGMPEVRLGIPSVIEAALLPSLIGWGRTRRLLYTGETIDAREAERFGLVERSVAAAELDTAVEEWVAAILACAPRAIRLQKALVRAWEELPPSRAVERGIAAFAQAYLSDEPRHLMGGFLSAAALRRKERGRPS